MGDHVWTLVDSNPPSCMQEGYEVYNCAVCMEERYVDLGILDHDLVVTFRQEPTCSEAGYVSYRCDFCYEAITETLPATGNHNWVPGSGPVEGSDDEYCQDCGTSRN